MTLSIGLSTKPHSLFSWIIRLYQNTAYSHTYIRININNYDLVLDATARGVVLRNYEDFFKSNKVVKEKMLEDIMDFEKLAEEIIPLLGKKYGYLTIIGIVLKDLGIKGIGKDGNNSFICSELVARVFEQYVGIETGAFDYLTPKDIETLMELL